MKIGNFYEEYGKVVFREEQNGIWAVEDNPVMPDKLPLRGDPVTVTVDSSSHSSAGKINNKPEIQKMINDFIRGFRREPKFIKLRRVDNNPTILFKRRES